MTINAYHVSPGAAIDRTLRLVKGMQRLASQGRRDALLSIYYEGEPGVGKSSIVRAIARVLNYKLVDRRANTLNPDDAAGTRMQNVQTRTTTWFPPEWMPNEDGTIDDLNEFGKPYAGTLLFFDELASADDRVRKPLFSVFLDREINGRHLPDNCLVFAAGNEAETGTLVNELDNATRTRFFTYRIVADFLSWKADFAPVADITPTAISYIQQNIHRFCETKQALDDGRQLYGNPRTWEHCSLAERAIMETPEDRNDPDARLALEAAIAGKAGTELATEYMAVFANVANMTDLIQILEASREERRTMWPNSIGQVYALTYSMMAYPHDIPTGHTILDLMEEFPDGSRTGLPFQEMKAPVREVILQRLKKAGIPEKQLNEAFEQGSLESVRELLKNGPLIRIA